MEIANASATSTALMIQRMAKLTLPIVCISCSAISRSDMVLVPTGEFANIRSMASETAAARIGSETMT